MAAHRDVGQRVADAVADLVRIPSVNPLQSDDSAITGERRLAEHLAEHAAAIGAKVTLDNVLDGRPNLEATFLGQRHDDVMIVDAHLDTVAVHHMSGDPFDGRIDDGRLFGRGSVDTKATFAVVMDVLAELHRNGTRPGPTVHLVGTVSEEMGGLLGARRLADRLGDGGLDDAVAHRARMIVAEPTSCAPVHGHKGGLGVEVCVHGHAAHSSQPELGVNAITAAARIIAAVDAENERLAALPTTTAVGPGTISVTEISGGTARNIIPDSCRLYIGRRLSPGEDPTVVQAELTATVTRAAGPATVDVALANGVAFPAFFTDSDNAFIGVLADITGEQPATVTYGSNCLAYDGIDVTKVVFGPGSIDQAHQAVEWVEISELVRAREVYATLLTM